MAAKTIVISVPKSSKSFNMKPLSVQPSQTNISVSATSPIVTFPSRLLSPYTNNLLSKNTSNLFSSPVKEEPMDYIDLSSESKPPRKRQRLDHLSVDQKVMRRKMKNRVAAQTARDRKKMQMDSMEGRIAKQSKEITALTAMVKVLKEQNKILIEKNSQFLNSMKHCSCQNVNKVGSSNMNGGGVTQTVNSDRTYSCLVNTKTPVSTKCAESAALAGSQPWAKAHLAKAVSLWVLMLTVSYLQVRENHRHFSLFNGRNKMLPLKSFKANLRALSPQTRKRLNLFLKSSRVKMFLKQLRHSNKSYLPSSPIIKYLVMAT